MTTLVTFVFDASTKNTHRYKEVVEENDNPVIGTLYVSKTAMENPKKTLKVKVNLS